MGNLVSRLFVTRLRDHNFPIDRHVADDCFRPIRPADTERVDEPGIAQLPSGRLILMSRPDGAIFYSEDEGESWTHSHCPFPEGAYIKTPHFKLH